VEREMQEVDEELRTFKNCNLQQAKKEKRKQRAKNMKNLSLLELNRNNLTGRTEVVATDEDLPSSQSIWAKESRS
jgi:hypothetical protein